MAEALIMSMAIGSGLAVAIAALEGRSTAGLFLSICCPDS
jgi:hypothetical protein